MPNLDLAFPAVIAIASLTYLMGSIPFGIVITKVMGLGDLREIGSGNIGATNVLRTGSKSAAFLTVVLDAGKGAVAVLLASYFFGHTAAQIAGIFAFLGHLYPVWLNFKGGKGVAVFLGILLALNFWVGLAACLTWLATALVLRISSASALVSSLFAPVWVYLIDAKSGVMVAIILAVFIWVKHSENIKRILKGVEPKIGKRG